MLAGGGIKGGVMHGTTTADGAEPATDPVGPADMAATVFTLMGIETEKRLYSAGGRPQQIVRNGSPIKAILA